MDLISIFRAVWRHKLVTIPVILFTCLGAFYVVAIKAPVYQASASFALVYPPAPPTQAQIVADPKLAKINTGQSSPGVQRSVRGHPDRDRPGWHIVLSASPREGWGGHSVSDRAERRLLRDRQHHRCGKYAASGGTQRESRDPGSQECSVPGSGESGCQPGYMIKTYQLATTNQAAQKLSGKLRSLIAVLGLGVLLLFIGISIAEAIGKGKRGTGSVARAESSTVAGGQMSTGRPYLYSEPDEGLRSSRFRSR